MLIYLTDLEQLLSAAKVPVQMQGKGVLVLSVCLIVSAKTEWGTTIGKKHGESFCNSEITLSTVKRLFYSKES